MKMTSLVYFKISLRVLLKIPVDTKKILLVTNQKESAQGRVGQAQVGKDRHKQGKIGKGIFEVIDI